MLNKQSNRIHTPRQIQQVLTGLKYCPTCEVFKSINMFNLVNVGWDGLFWQCKQCKRAAATKWRNDNPELAADMEHKNKYGITLADKELIFKSQGSVCAACGTDKPSGKYNKWNTDHDHKTGKIRGVLCANCNTALGLVYDSIPRLQGLVRYLNKYQPAVV